MALHDAELIQRTLAGDESAFGFLVDKYKGSVHALAYRKLGDFHTAEEITQDTFLKAYQKLSTLRDPARFPGWLYVIAARCCISWFRQNRLQTESFDRVKGEMNAQSWAKYADVRVREEVHSALENLPESERTVLTLYYMAGMTCEEIGRFIGTSCGAIRDRLYRARIRLKEELTMIEETLRGFQLPPTVTQEIMRRIPNGSLNSAPTGKPLAPWIVATSLAVVALLIGLGIRQTGTFQLPYSFDAPESATMVEIVDAPIIEMPPLKLSQVNRAGGLDGGESGSGNREDGSVWEATSDSQNDMESDKIGWMQTNGPYGGTITALHATPEGMLFAGTQEAGIFRSTDGGETWVPANEGLRVYQDKILPNILVLTQEGNTLYAGTNGDLFYSTNGGDSWKQLTHFQDEMGISGVVIIGDMLYIGRRTEESVFFSNNNGKSWAQIDSGLTGRDMLGLVARGTTLFAKMRNHVFRLKAGENSWTKLTPAFAWTKPTAVSDVSEKIVSFAISENNLYAATADGGLFRSTDMGNSWRSIQSKLMQHFGGELAAVGNTVFYIGSGSADGRVFRSTDAGNSWTMFNTGLINQTILSIAILSEKTLYVGTYDGVFHSTDGGESWAQTNTGIINTWVKNLVFFKNALYASTGISIVKSVDGGNSWVPIHRGLRSTHGAVLTITGENLYVVVDGIDQATFSTSAVLRLSDDGNRWMPIQTKMQSAKERMYTVDRLVEAGETFYAIAQMSQGERLYRWKAGEDLWADLGLKDLQWGTLAVSGRTVYVGARDGKLFRSVDEGDTWTDVSQHLPNWELQSKRGFREGGYDLAFVGGTIYVDSMYDGVFRSTDSGETWTPIIDGLPSGVVDIQLVDGTTLYGTDDLEIFRLTHGSDSWELVASMQPMYVPSMYITALALDGTTLYIGTEAEGVFRLSLDE